MHVYGLTETYGYFMQCAWNEDGITKEEKKLISAQPRIRYPNTEDVDYGSRNYAPVPRDGKTIGEIMIRGNIVMKGYFKDKKATEKAMKGGWFHLVI